MNVFLTGATGFIGAHVARRLAHDGYSLRCLVRAPGRAGGLVDLGATLVPGDLSDRDSLREGMRGCEWVINVAGLYSLWEADRRRYQTVNVEGTRKVCEAALEVGVARVVHVSTAAVYGKPVDAPFTEESAVGPVRFSEYARTKYRGELIAWELHRTRGLPLVVISPGVVLGPGDAKATGQYIHDLAQRRLPAMVFDDSVFTFVHVRDVAEAVVRAAEKESAVGQKYLVGHEQLTWRAFSEQIAETAGVPLPRPRLPELLAMGLAALLTGVADLTGRPPQWGMSLDGMRMARVGFRFDGSKAARELGIAYTPIRDAIREALAARGDRP